MLVILDRAGGKRRQIRAGCGRDDTDGAAKALAKYIGSLDTTTVGATDPRSLAIADVLTFYEGLKRPKSGDPRILEQHDLLLLGLLDLNTFFGRAGREAFGRTAQRRSQGRRGNSLYRPPHA